MPLEIRLGDVVPVPCRSCGKLLQLRVVGGEFNLECPTCNRTTQARVVNRPTGIQVFTSLQGNPKGIYRG